MMSVVLYQILRKYNESLALGAVIFRGVLELVSYLGIAASWLLLVTVSGEYVSAGSPDGSTFQLMGSMLRNAELQIGSTGLGAIVFSIGAIIIYYIFFKTKLIPIWLSLWGLIGGILYLVSPILNMIDIDAGFMMYLLALQEMVMAVWLIVKGFDESAFNSLMVNHNEQKSPENKRPLKLMQIFNYTVFYYIAEITE